LFSLWLGVPFYGEISALIIIRFLQLLGVPFYGEISALIIIRFLQLLGTVL